LVVGDLDAVERGSDCDRAELGRLLVGEPATQLSEGRADCRDDHRTGHAGNLAALPYTTAIPTDLITPLRADVRLRGQGEAAFLLESVEGGRLGRHSFVGSGTRTIELAEAESATAPVVGYLAYDHVAALEPTVQLPDDGPDLPQSRFAVADTLMR